MGQRVQLSCGAMAHVYVPSAFAWHNTLYHAVLVYTGMYKTLEKLETLALHVQVFKPVFAVLYIPVYTSTAWYNLYL